MLMGNGALSSTPACLMLVQVLGWSGIALPQGLGRHSTLKSLLVHFCWCPSLSHGWLIPVFVMLSCSKNLSLSLISWHVKTTGDGCLVRLIKKKKTTRNFANAIRILGQRRSPCCGVFTLFLLAETGGSGRSHAPSWANWRV